MVGHFSRLKIQNNETLTSCVLMNSVRYGNLWSTLKFYIYTFFLNSYLWPRTSGQELVRKSTFFTRRNVNKQVPVVFIFTGNGNFFFTYICSYILVLKLTCMYKNYFWMVSLPQMFNKMLLKIKRSSVKNWCSQKSCFLKLAARFSCNIGNNHLILLISRKSA